MANVGSIVIQFKAEADKARREIGKLTNDLGGVGKKTDRVSGKLANFAKVGVLGIAGAAAGAATALFQMGEEAADNARSAENLRRILERTTDATKEQTDATEEWIGKLELATNVADNDLREALGRLVVASGDARQAQELLALAVDTSTARGEALDTVIRSMEKALGGNTNALKRQMPFLDANKDGTVTLTEAVEGLEKAYGGAAEAAAEKDPWETLNTVFGNLREEIGSALLPKMEELGEWLQSPEGQDAIDGWIQSTSDFADAMADLGDEIGPVVDMLGDIKDAYDAIPSWLKKNPLSGVAEQWAKRPWGPAANAPGTKKNPIDSPPTLRPGVQITVNNPKPEPASQTVARMLRVAKMSGY